MKSLQNKFPFELHIETGPFKWKDKVDFQLRQARRYPDDTLISTDSSDFLFVGEPEEVEEILANRKLFLQATKHDWPGPKRRAMYGYNKSAYDDGATELPWRYVCSGLIAGKGHAIQEAIEYGYEHFPIQDSVADGRHLWEQDSDQRFWADVFLAGYGELDYRCELSQTLRSAKPGELMVDGKRLRNMITGTYPQFLHANASTWHFIPKALLPC